MRAKKIATDKRIFRKASKLGGIKINSNFLMPVMCILIFTQFTGLQFTQLSGLLIFQRTLLILMVAGLFLFHLFQSSRGVGLNYDSVAVCILLLSIWYILLTVFNHGSLNELLQKISYLVGPWLFFAIYGLSNPKLMFRACYVAFLAMVFMNLIGVIVTYKYGGFAPELGTYWLFGQRTYMRNILFPALFFSVINDRIRNTKCSFSTLFLMVQNPIILFLVDSMTSLMLSLLIDFVLILMLSGMKFKKIVIPFAILNLVLDFAIVIVRKVEWISSFIINVLHRDLTFSGRAEIWDLVQEEISKSPLFGTGFHNIEDNGLVLSPTKNVSNAHNELLDVTYKGGFIALILFLFLVIKCIISLLKSTKPSVAGILGLFLGAFFIEAVVSDIWYPQFFLLLYLAAYISIWETVFDETVYNQ